MSRLVKINYDLYEAAKREARFERRTIQAQVEFWIKVGRAAIDNPDLPASFIADSLASLLEPKAAQFQLDGLLANWNSEMKCLNKDDEWLEAKPVGKEVW
ncbi:hypothetical protein [Polynucleobacter sp. AP-Kolm-20A-A1]|uniref:TA system antitoxin ParD family protein n=1 Tax=Polynucleobacter sp. AP-Kolm-20A-A1 TaxID=2081041 RepID=UPI001BFD9896|nr:hypothetical protein [Polynucleobacter sp. AP-Kolm-20A-A1]QWE19892.1 hypothetical protein C2745_05640 [Polynucleobacter sp. AP-Kolm-20A-A1]